MKGRVLPAIGIVVITLACLLLSPLTRMLFLLVCACASLWETRRILDGSGPKSFLVLLFAYMLGAGLLSWFCALTLWYATLLFITVTAILFAGVILYKGEGRSALCALAVLCYPGVPFTFLLFIAGQTDWLPAFAVGVLSAWICDSAALLVGKRFGKHLLPNPVSPHKTIEGCLAGVGASLLVGLLCWALLKSSFPTIPLWLWLAAAFLCSSWGQVGDLAASLVKRTAGVKDFSHLIPEHGGVMDKFDSMLFSLPLAYICFKAAEALFL